jgi:hypothetical protein
LSSKISGLTTFVGALHAVGEIVAAPAACAM